MMTYLEDGHCSLSNNLSENAIRPFTVGRKNWLFSASPKGATASAIVYTMVEMAKANDLNKAGIHYAYLPPYSPDLNPIEKMWSKMKAILRKHTSYHSGQTLLKCQMNSWNSLPHGARLRKRTVKTKIE